MPPSCEVPDRLPAGPALFPPPNRRNACPATLPPPLSGAVKPNLAQAGSWRIGPMTPNLAMLVIHCLHLACSLADLVDNETAPSKRSPAQGRLAGGSYGTRPRSSASQPIRPQPRPLPAMSMRRF